ncbi:MAG: helix-turn-helix domain-containing protein, partial [Miltoncostaeaceae bacterium]
MDPAPPSASLRADARRNLERILTAAEEVFRDLGPDAGIAEVAQRAGVGQATVIRRFPTKEALWAELLGRRMEALAAEARRQAGVVPTAQALERFMVTLAQRYAADRGFHEGSAGACALDASLDGPRRALVVAAGDLLALAQDAGRIREDVRAEDVFFICAAVNHRFRPGDPGPELWRRYLDLMLDGLRTPRPEPHSAPGPSI